MTETPPPQDRPAPPPYQGVYGRPQDYVPPAADPAEGPQPAFQPADPAYGQPQQPYDPSWGYGPPGVTPQQQYMYGIPHSDLTTALWCYIGSLLGGFLVPLIIYFVKKKDSPFVRFHAAQALNFGLTQMIVVFSWVVPIVIIAIAANTPAVLVLIVPVYLYELVAPWVWMIMGAIKSNRGEWWRIPTWTCFRMVR